ncbi:MAG: hypothetical protein CL612_01230 [Anaerolineaceae bacterium]|nr:hypothetical protein [Anaerolineaceae bacterium]
MFLLSMQEIKAVVALLLTLFLGGIGAHIFYLGKPVLGILYLAFS